MAESTEQTLESKSTLARFAQDRPLTLFFALAYAWAWTFWLVAPRALRWTVPGSVSDPSEIALFIVGAFGPTVSALTTRWLGHCDLKICSLWAGWRRLVIGLAVGL